MNFSHKRVVILGLGILGGGVGTARYFAENADSVVITDLRSKKELASSIDQLSCFNNITFRFGPHKKIDVKDADLIVPNPAVPRNASILSYARSQNIPVEMAESIFLRIFGTERVVGITGTRGKSTTSSLLYTILEKSGYDVYLAGNMKNTSSLELLNKVTDKSIVILELSSWQLAGLSVSRLSPHRSIMTNLYPDHLNRYDSMDEYIADKQNIFKYQKKDDFLFINKDNELLVEKTKYACSHKIYYSKNDLSKKDSFLLIGNHNRENIAAAITGATSFGIKVYESIKIIKSYSGLPGRLEKIAQINGVSFYNDTTSTTPIAGVCALRSFPQSNIILIAGGNSKNLDATEFIDEVCIHTKAVVYLPGDATEEFKKAILRKNKTKKYYSYGAKSMIEAVKQSFTYAKNGDIVLLSPGFTSFGSFANEYARGESFNHAVQTLISQQKKAKLSSD